MTLGSARQATVPTDRELVLSRVFDAPRELVWRAWTDPRRLAQWWGPRSFSNPVCELELRAGGAIRIDMTAPDGAVYPMKGTVHEVVEPERLVFSSTALEDEQGVPQLEAHNTVTFADEQGKTRLTLRAVVVKAAPGAAAALAGMEEGWNQSLDCLAEHLNLTCTIFTTPTEREIVITRWFDAPRALVFKAMTDPALVPHWWGPRGHTTTVEQMDARPGGAWRFISRTTDGATFAFRGVYREITPPERLVYTFEFEPMPGYISLESVSFEEIDGKTRLTNTVSFHSTADRDGMLQSGMTSGATETMDRFGELLERIKQGASNG